MPCPLLFKEQFPQFFDLGITTAFNYVAIQWFVVGFKPVIHEMMKGMPVILRDIFKQAITLEKIHMPLKTNTPMVAEITDDQDTVELDGEIEVDKRASQIIILKMLSTCVQKKRHFQDECYNCIAKGPQCADANGVPLKSQPPILPENGLGC
jgi:hypothetical protein